MPRSVSCRAGKTPTLASNTATTETLPICGVPYDLSAMRADQSALPGHLVRFSVGLESVTDLQADLAQALSRIHPVDPPGRHA